LYHKKGTIPTVPKKKSPRTARAPESPHEEKPQADFLPAEQMHFFFDRLPEGTGLHAHAHSAKSTASFCHI